MKTWLLSDTHLNHEKIKTWCQRPDDFTERLDKNVRQMVKPEDLVIHLGDVGIGKSEEFMKTVESWPGRWVLVRGNHDGKSCQYYMDHGFSFACDAMVYRGVWLTHKPWRQELPEGTFLNVHGHLHNVWDGFLPDDPEKSQDEFAVALQLGRLPKPWHRLFAVEYTDYKPVEFDKFVAKGHKLFQSTGPNAETKKKMEAAKLPDCSDVGPLTTPAGWDLDTGNGFNSRGYPAGHGTYHDPMG
jgi:calcineurin-like phosphoesterase family protein